MRTEPKPVDTDRCVPPFKLRYRCCGRHEGGGDHIMVTTHIPQSCDNCGSREHLELIGYES